MLEDPDRRDLYIWGVPTARIAPDHQLIDRVLHAGAPIVVNAVTLGRLPEALAAVFTADPTNCPSSGTVSPTCTPIPNRGRALSSIPSAVRRTSTPKSIARDAAGNTM